MLAWFGSTGRVYEAIRARRERRSPLDLYHSALEVRVREGRFIIENAWASPDADIASHGVMVEVPVFGRRIARFRLFRYEVRRWRDGLIPDAGQAVASPHRLSDDPRRAQRLLHLAATVLELIWGRDELGPASTAAAARPIEVTVPAPTVGPRLPQTGDRLDAGEPLDGYLDTVRPAS